MTVGIIVIAVLFFLMILGVPIAISLIWASIAGFISSVYYIPLEVVPQRMLTSVDSFPLLAIPFFMLTGEFMMSGSMGKRIAGFAFATVGWIRAGLAQVSTLTSMFFAGISGSGAADTAAVGKMMIPMMEEKGYDKGFAAATVASAGTIAVVIPPSIPMIVYGVTAGVSIGDLFTAGIIPGILIGISIMMLNYWITKKKRYSEEMGKFEFTSFRKAFIDGILALMLPLIIILGIRGGIFTPTEAGAVAAAYAFILNKFVYKDMEWKDVPESFLNAAKMTAMVVFIIAAANLFGWLLTAEQIPQVLAGLVTAFSENKYIILLLFNIIFFIAGCFLNASAAITILTPLLLPIALAVGIDPIFFGVVMVVNLSIGLITPPVGLDLFIVQGIANVSYDKLIRSIVPFILIMVFDLLLITYIPAISMFLTTL
ncbi:MULTISPECIES: TRAP transporter large permease [Bacillaceae]|uniref:TRAP transporter large permease n=1 Tax=Bacillaceae TaxID=186817 RepID=UPI000C78C011|nr:MULTISPECIES: TRAP transporter large permease [Bacillaceae]PLR69205.1 C4-dicarboxylate ABC transporter permease [Bacillus sp. UMB0893]QNG59328.1 TRAP transporter large permease [Bacillus sp. PAMC26568]